jgi:hypothetical protein
MLARSSTSIDADLSNIVVYTAAVVFLGTPHRGSQDLAALGEFVRSLASTFRIQTAPAILDALGLKSSDPERAQEAFSALWQKYDFRVKTFQEGLSLTGLNLGLLGNKVVPDYSSLIGGHRERTETLQANHKDLCRLSRFDDPNYRKFAGEVRSIYISIQELSSWRSHKDKQLQTHGSVVSMASSSRRPRGAFANDLSESEKACLQSLWFPTLHIRHQHLERPAEKTCSWVFKHELYLDWFLGRKRNKHRGLLWLKGNPGTGKSVLMKKAFHRAVKASFDYQTAALFFNAKGCEPEKTPNVLFRSLLYHLLLKHVSGLQHFRKAYEQKAMAYSGNDSGVMWGEQELYFWRKVTLSAHEMASDWKFAYLVGISPP